LKAFPGLNFGPDGGFKVTKRNAVWYNQGLDERLGVVFEKSPGKDILGANRYFERPRPRFEIQNYYSRVRVPKRFFQALQTFSTPMSFRQESMMSLNNGKLSLRFWKKRGGRET
jgi:hypothetical protein